MPDVYVHDLERAWEVFCRGEAFAWRWPPDVLERQDEGLMNDLTVILAMASRVKEVLENG